MDSRILTILAVVFISLLSFIGALVLLLKVKTLKKVTNLFVSLGIGTLLGDAFFHLIPEIYESQSFSEQIPFYFLAGILTFYLLESLLHWHHCHKTNHNHEKNHSFAISNLFADAIHNFLDGLIIASGFLISIEVGIATTIAVALHEIPQEIGDLGILIHSGLKAKKALLYNFFSALVSILGASFLIFIGNYESLNTKILAFATGSFLYVAIADLIPEVKKESNISKALLQFLTILIGLSVMFFLTFLEG